MKVDEAIEYIKKIIEQDKKTFDEQGYRVISSKMTQSIETVLKEYKETEKANDRLLVMYADYKINYISKDKIREKIDKYADKLLLDINHALNVEQNTAEMKAFYTNLRIKLEGQLLASRDIEKLLEEE